MLVDIETVKLLLDENRSLILAGDEAVLRAVPAGRWIGGTIPYFMTSRGGTTSRSHAFVVQVPDDAISARIVVYDEQTIQRIGLDSPEHGYTILILPAFTRLHRLFALESPRYEQQFFKVVAGWVAGTHLDDIGRVTPKVFVGTTGEGLESSGVAMHVELPSNRQAKVGIVNIFEQGEGEAIQFPDSGFRATECIVRGRRENILDFVGRSGLDLRLPLVSDFCGTKFNVGIRAADIVKRSLSFFAPVFEGVTYRAAKPIDNYAQRFADAIPPDIGQPVFGCNCVLNHLHGQLDGRHTGAVLGPMTFGEIAYQLLNQTMVHITITHRRQ
jgi:hypothetical protein